MHESYSNPSHILQCVECPHYIREKLPSVSKWPTFPQLFINGELIGGEDIVEAMNSDGSLLPLLQAAARATHATSKGAPSLSPSEVEGLIAGAYSGAEIHIEGQGCDLSIAVGSEHFAELTIIKQHHGKSRHSFRYRHRQHPQSRQNDR